MKVFFYGLYRRPGGPCEVNRNIVRCLSGQVMTKDKYGKISGRIENIVKILRSNVVIFSGLMFYNYELIIAKLLKKKIIYIMHGCARIETGKNRLEEQVIKKSDLILCVSSMFRKVMSDIYPEYNNKYQVLFNGINWEEIRSQKENLHETIVRNCNRIILFGGGRGTKMNLKVCQAVQNLNDAEGTNFHVDVYGYYRDGDDSREISKIPCVQFHHVIPHAQVNIELMNAQIFIQNSEFEPFSLSIFDALQCGCDILLSQYVGCKDIIPGLSTSDIIYNPSDLDELKEKILELRKNSNNVRLLSSIDKCTTGIEHRAKELLRYCEMICEKDEKRV